MDPFTANSSRWRPRAPSDQERKAVNSDFERSLRFFTTSQLSTMLTDINSRLAQRPAPLLDSLITKLAQESLPLGRSTSAAIPPGPSTRGQNAEASPQSRPPSPLDLLASSMRMGPRLAGKLILASARSVTRDQG